MEEHARRRLFDRWADSYDQSVSGPDDSFPFAGYEEVHSLIVREAQPEPGMTVLDVGIGTGKLAAHFQHLGCAVWGVDFSEEMLAKAGERLPDVRLVRANILGDWPVVLMRRFDRIASAYVLHEFSLDAKICLLRRLVSEHLDPEGRVVVGDIAFATRAARDEARERWRPRWDDDEHYWAADETAAAAERAGLELSYSQVSPCAGVFVIGDA